MEWLLPACLCVLLISAASFALSAYALHRACNAEIEVKAFKASTHQVQFVPADEIPDAPGSDRDDKEFTKGMSAEERRSWDSLSQYSEPLS